MPKLSIGIQRAARITSLIFGIVPILVFLSFTIHLLIAKYYAFPPHTLTLLDIKFMDIRSNSTMNYPAGISSLT